MLRDWPAALVTLAITVAINVAIVAYSYGTLDQRVSTLEAQRAEQRAELAKARERIEAAIGQLRDPNPKGKQ